MAYLGKTPSQAVRSRYYYTATGGETSLSGADDNSNVLTFTDGNYVDVSLNGATLVAGSDYNTTTTNTIGGLAALTASDIVEVLVYDTFSVFGGNMAANLNFKDNIKVNFGTGNDLQIFHDGSNSIIRDAGTGSLKFQYGTSDGVVFDSSGNVGIGNITPSSFYSLADNLVVGTGSGGNGMTIYSGSTDSGYIGFNDTASASMQGFIQYNHSGDYMAFAPNGTEKVRITSSGNVKIGDVTTDVTSKLTVSGNGSADTATFMYDGSAGTYFDINTNAANGVVSLEANARSGNFPPLTFTTGGSEAGRWDASGNLLVGKTASNVATEGAEIRSSGFTGLTVDGGAGLTIRRLTSDGELQSFFKDTTKVGSIGVDNTDNLTISGNSSHCGLNFSSDDINPYKNGAYTNGTTSLGSSSTRFNNLYLSGGVYLGGTGSANHLDDYEEGTWTPVSGTITLSSSSGKYIKIGNLVSINWTIEFPSNSDASNSAIVGGLPFNVASTQYNGTTAITNFGSSNILPMVNHADNTVTFRTYSNTTYTNANMSSKFHYGWAVYTT